MYVGRLIVCFFSYIVKKKKFAKYCIIILKVNNILYYKVLSFVVKLNKLYKYFLILI